MEIKEFPIQRLCAIFYNVEHWKMNFLEFWNVEKLFLADQNIWWDRGHVLTRKKQDKKNSISTT